MLIIEERGGLRVRDLSFTLRELETVQINPEGAWEGTTKTKKGISRIEDGQITEKKIKLTAVSLADQEG